MRPEVPEFERCHHCKGEVMLPPGIYYRGFPYHKQCARLLRRKDIATEQVEPKYDIFEQELTRALEHIDYESITDA